MSNNSSESGIEHYRGYSPCRLCDKEDNGSAEFAFVVDKVRWLWPEGYMHYLRDHNVCPSDEFAEILRNRTLLKAAKGTSGQDAAAIDEEIMKEDEQAKEPHVAGGSDATQQESSCSIM